MSPNGETGLGQYVASFLVGLLAILVGIVLAFAIPDSIPYHGLLSQLTIVVVLAVGFYAMLRIEEGPGPILRRLRNR